MMKPRPRQIDYQKPFLTIDKLEIFNQEEGQELEIKASERIITPDQLVDEKKNRSKAEKPEQILKSMQPVGLREDYIKYKANVYPDGNHYELTDEDVKLLGTFNEKLLNPVQIEDFEQYISILDLKSGKDVIIDFATFYSLQAKLQIPKSISSLSYTQQEQLYLNYRNLREHHMRPLLRSLMHPYFEDSNPQLAFRPRSQPTDRTMKLRRGNAQNQRGLNEMENIGQKIIQLKKELHAAYSLVEQSLQREKGFEIDRRFSFCKFIKKVVDRTKNEKDQSHEMRLWRKDCFVRHIQERCAINIIERAEEMFELIGKDIQDWKSENEQLRKERQKKDDQITRFENLFADILQDKRTASDTDNVPPPVIPPEIPPVPPPLPPDERLESIARFMATVYLEAKKYKLNFDAVMSENFPIIVAPVPTTPGQQSYQVKYKLLAQEGSDLIYRVPMSQGQTKRGDFYWESFQEPSLNGTLHQTYGYFRERVHEIMEMADVDQMLYNCVQEDEKHDEEELKQLRKKIKLTATRSVTVNNGVHKA